MKTNLSFLLAAFLVYAGLAFIQAEPQSSGDVKSVNITSLGGWTLKVNADGSGTLAFGSTFDCWGRFPKNTVLPSDIFNHFVKEMSAGNIHNAVMVTYMDSSGNLSTRFTQNRAFVTQLMVTVFSKTSFLNQAQAEDVSKKHAFVSQPHVE